MTVNQQLLAATVSKRPRDLKSALRIKICPLFLIVTWSCRLFLMTFQRNQGLVTVSEYIQIREGRFPLMKVSQCHVVL